MTDAEEARLEASTALYRELGLEVRLLGRREARAMVPPLSGAVRAAAYCPDDAAAYPQWAVRAFARAARDRGARFVTGTRVEGVLRGAGRVLGVFAGGRTWRADSVVVAAGPWSAEVGAAAGLNVPVLPRRSQIMVTERTAPVLEPFLSGNGVYCRQSPFGHLLIGGGGPWERTDFDTANAVPTLRRLATRFLELFPGLGQLRLLRAWAGTVEITPDHLPILGPAPGLDGLVLACGFSGNGFAVGPAAGRAVADLIIHGQARWDLTPFRPDRFPGDLDWPAEYRRRFGDAREPVEVEP